MFYFNGMQKVIKIQNIFRSLFHPFRLHDISSVFFFIRYSCYSTENIGCLHGLCAPVRLQSRQLQNACDKKKKKIKQETIHKMAKMESEPDKKFESKNGLDDANTNMSIYAA